MQSFTPKACIRRTSPYLSHPLNSDNLPSFCKHVSVKGLHRTKGYFDDPRPSPDRHIRPFPQPVVHLQLYFAHHIAQVSKVHPFGLVEGVSEVHETIAIFTGFVQGLDEFSSFEG